MDLSRISLIALVAAAAILVSDGLAAPRINVRAQNLSKKLGPSKIDEKKGSAGDINAIRSRAIPILIDLEDSYRTNGPTPESLIENAYDMREDIGPYEMIVTGQNLIAAWKQAHSLGLFDENGKFKDKISLGRFDGESAIFEHIVPAGEFPAGSTHLANFRIVAPDRKREEGQELSHRETAFHEQMVKLVAEIHRNKRFVEAEKGPEMNNIGQTLKEAKEIWMKEVELAGEAFNEKPNIRIEARVTATPSHMSKERWRVTSEIRNLSSHPTKIAVEYWLLGITDEKRDHYIMAKGSEEMELRKGEEREMEVFTKAKLSYKNKADDHDELDKKERQRSKVRYRGFIIQVKHGEDVTAQFASDKHLIGYVDEEDPMTVGSLPTF